MRHKRRWIIPAVLVGVLLGGGITVTMLRSRLAAADAQAAATSQHWGQRRGERPAVLWPAPPDEAANAAIPLREFSVVWESLPLPAQEAFGDPAQVSEQRRLLEAHPLLLHAAQEAARRERYRPDGMTIEVEGLTGFAGDLGLLRRAMSVLAAASRVEADRGEWSRAVAHVNELMHLRNLMAEWPFLVAALVAMAADAQALTLMESIAPYTPESRQWIDVLDAGLPTEWLRRAMIGEADLVLREFTRMAEESGFGARIGGLFGFSPQAAQTHYLTAMGMAIDQLDLPESERNWRAPEVAAERNRLAAMFVPNLSRAAAHALDLSRRRAALALAIDLRHGGTDAEELLAIDPGGAGEFRGRREGARVLVEQVHGEGRVTGLLEWPAESEDLPPPLPEM